MPRQVTLNLHRVRYWLSVGATPTPKVARLLHKFGFVPKPPAPFGSQHVYEKPERVYNLGHFRGMGEKRTITDNKVAIFYRQKLQEQMNIVERKRRLTSEALGNTHAAVSPYAQPDTDDVESEEADIFARKDKFEVLLKKFQTHQKQKGLLLKGNDLRSNVWLKKMNKLARDDLGLDISGYKDYVHNLKEFANVHTDLAILARDNLFNDDSAD